MRFLNSFTVIWLKCMITFKSLSGGAAIPGISRDDVYGATDAIAYVWKCNELSSRRSTLSKPWLLATEDLIRRFEEKIQATIARVWGEG